MPRNAISWSRRDDRSPKAWSGCAWRTRSRGTGPVACQSCFSPNPRLSACTLRASGRVDAEVLEQTGVASAITNEQHSHDGSGALPTLPLADKPGHAGFVPASRRERAVRRQQGSHPERKRQRGTYVDARCCRRAPTQPCRSGLGESDRAPLRSPRPTRRFRCRRSTRRLGGVRAHQSDCRRRRRVLRAGRG